jgi:putative endonuclease
MSQQWWVYMVQTQSGKLYTGISTDVDRRFEQHKAMNANSRAGVSADGELNNVINKSSNKGAKFFYSDPARTVVYREICSNRSDASKREAQIKKLHRKEKCRLAGIRA